MTRWRKMKGKGTPRCAQNPTCFGKIPNVEVNKYNKLGNLCHPCGWYLNMRRKYEEIKLEKKNYRTFNSIAEMIEFRRNKNKSD